MTDESCLLAVDGVRFFGEMSASVSHEIKNVLAIIKENAGLLQDMLAMNARGLPLDPERLTRLAQSIDRQVARGDGIIKNMNRFAHSADHPSETVDVHETIGFVIDLAARLIVMKGRPPRFEAATVTLTAVTNRFFLERLIWACLCCAMEACDPEGTISVVAERIDATVRIRFQGLAENFFIDGTPFPSPEDATVGRMIGAQLSADENAKEIVIVLS
ncbi:histidine kinase dimerization/phospho-acceptor domain-containing protein [uncultured Desulfosarcina sp.]|uniref:histidine kinase dimerization/phospho-acceptor domain-containing protein n=1 Tax=uncultured Desulfosarcina sp. TaxID=218289 RepID=UPI0029C7075C|nr:histidine kinase dimerization/phospho-acceptor domain-containing protein [uncultured Desulfosarcina sp.]